MNTHKTIAFIGAGNMARAMIAGLLQNGYNPKHIWASSPGIAQRDHYKNNLPIHVTTDNIEAAKHADVIVLAVKPFIAEAVLTELRSVISDKKPLLISIMTGITTPTIAQWIDHKAHHIVRTMPNIASAVSAGMSGLFANSYVCAEDKTFAESLFRSVGTTLWVDDESQLDIITAVSGSGPAYLFYFFDAMQKTAESLGLTAEQSKLLVSQTATGAAKMVMETGETFDQLRRFVTAEKGTTAAATAVFDHHNTKMIVDEAIRAALNRAKELAR